MSHTPGPWTVKDKRYTESGEEMYPVEAGDLYDTVALVGSKIDAHLIAVAPEMLAALRLSISPGTKDDRLQTINRTVMKVIAKATGQTQEKKS